MGAPTSALALKLPESVRTFRLNGRFLLVLLVVAAIVHIVSTFAALNDTSQSAFTRMARTLPANKFVILPAVDPAHQPLPFLSPDARYAMCHFDTANGPVAVYAQLPDHGWTIGVYRPDGSSAYFAAAPPGRFTQINLNIGPADNRFLGLTPEAKGKINSGQAPLTVTAKEGLIVVRAPDRGLAYAAEDEQGLTKSACAPKAY